MTTDEGTGIQAFVDRMVAHTVRVLRNATAFPEGFAMGSGFLVLSGDDFILISAGHVLREPGPWTLETGAVGPAGTLHIPLTGLQLFDQIEIPSGEHEEVDFAWADVSRAEITRALHDHRTGANQVEVPVYTGPLTCAAIEGEPYGFAALNRPRFDANLGHLEWSLAYEVYLSLNNRDDTSGVLTFDLARPHQGHSYYHGASGAPIADAAGNIVAILINGSEGKNQLYGMEIRRFGSLFQML